MKTLRTRLITLAAGSLVALSLSANVFADTGANSNATGIGQANAQTIANGPGLASETSTAVGIGFDQSLALGSIGGVTPPIAKNISVGYGNCSTNGTVINLGGQAGGSGSCAGTGSGSGSAAAK